MNLKSRAKDHSIARELLQKNTMALKILIIDDDAAFRKILELRFRSFISGMDVTTFDNLQDARAFLSSSKERFDLIVLDEHLPDGRGVSLLGEGWFEDLAVLCVSSDTSPEIPGATLRAGAAYFLNKVQVSEPLFEPLVKGIIDRNVLQQQLNQARIETAKLNTIRTLVATLRHEIKNPLGAVLGAAYLLRKDNTAPEQKQAAELIESSGKRIDHVLDQLCEAAQIEQTTKGKQDVFHIPGDKPWEE